MRTMRSSGRPAILLPQPEGLVVVVIDGDGEPVLVETEVAGQQPPGVFDGVLLEIVAEGEIAEHLEEGVVAGGVADVVEVVVLAAGADAFLGGRGAHVGALLDLGEDVLELHHAGIGEHQRRVVARDERARGNDFVAASGEELQETRPDLVDAAHEHLCLGRISPGLLNHGAAGRHGNRGRRRRIERHATNPTRRHEEDFVLPGRPRW